jgi:hypothetical protein
LAGIHGKHPVSTDGGTLTAGLPVPEINHHIHSPLEKSIIERTVQYKGQDRMLWWLLSLQQKEGLQFLSYQKLAQPVCDNA